MKRILILSLALLLGCLAQVAAQTGLQVDAHFGGRHKGRADITEVYHAGKQLSRYGLTLFRSLTLVPTAAEAAAIERSVVADGRGATDKDVGLHAGRLYYGFYQLPDRKGVHRFIFYRNNALRGTAGATLTLIYMEGHASVADLKRQFAR